MLIVLISWLLKILLRVERLMLYGLTSCYNTLLPSLFLMTMFY